MDLKIIFWNRQTIIGYLCSGAKPRGCCGRAIVFTTTQKLNLAAEQGFLLGGEIFDTKKAPAIADAFCSPFRT